MLQQILRKSKEFNFHINFAVNDYKQAEAEANIHFHKKF